MVRKDLPEHRRQSVVQKWVKETYPDEDLWTLAEVADWLERSPFTLRRWIRNGLLDPPSRYGYMGDNLIYLFTLQDVQRAALYCDALRPGRPTEAHKQRLAAIGKNPRTGENKK